MTCEGEQRMQSGTELAREIQRTDWSTAGNLSNRSSGVQIPRDICTLLKRYLYSAKCSWIINISYSKTFCCVVSLSIFTSCSVFWRARRASQNTNNE